MWGVLVVCVHRRSADGALRRGATWGAGERWRAAQVRRKAEGAKEALQTFVRRWTDDPKVKGHPSHQRVLGP